VSGGLIAASIISASSGAKLIRRETLTRMIIPAALVGLGIVAVALSSLKQQWTPGVLEVAGATAFASLFSCLPPL